MHMGIWEDKSGGIPSSNRASCLALPSFFGVRLFNSLPVILFPCPGAPPELDSASLARCVVADAYSRHGC